MYTVITQLKTRAAFITELICFSIALATAEVFFKFHSFILECSAFLLLWLCLGAVGSYVFGQQDNGPPV